MKFLILFLFVFSLSAKEFNSDVLTLGKDGSSADIVIEAKNGSDRPFLKYDKSGPYWIVSDDGISSSVISAEDPNLVKTIGDFTLTGNITFSNTISGNLLGNVTGDVTGDVTGNAGTVTNGVYTSGNQTISGVKTFSSTISGSISGNAGTVTNGVYTNTTQTITGDKTFSGLVSISSAGGGGGNVPHNCALGTTVSDVAQSVTATCPAGKIAVGGRCSTYGATLANAGMTSSTAFNCFWLAAGGTNTARALCCDY